MLENLYQETIIEHGKNPRNYGDVEGYTHIAHGKNPLCGDHIVVMLKVVDGILEDISFHGDGCAISKSAASLLTTALKGKTIDEVEEVLTIFDELLTTEKAPSPLLGKLQVFEGVKLYPSRIKCASLSLRAIEQALKGKGEVSTE